MKSSAENKQFLFELTQAGFLNFTIYFFIRNRQILKFGNFANRQRLWG